jgi:hypothetical protein
MTYEARLQLRPGRPGVARRLPGHAAGRSGGPGGAQIALAALPPAPPILKDPPRRQARFPMHRAATCFHSCRPSINPSLSPAPPHRRWDRPVGSRPEGKGVAAIGFSHPGCHRHSRGPVDCIACHYASLDSTKRSGEFASFEVPRVGPFLPRVGLFCPRVVFSTDQTISLSFSFFREGERGREGAAAAKVRSTSLKACNRLQPRVGDPIHGFSVDCFLSRSKRWRGFAADRASIHASTCGNACVPPAVAPAGGGYGR